MTRALTFIQIVIEAFIGCLSGDALKVFGSQCVSRDTKGCAETRVKCVSNNLKLLIPSSGIIDTELEIERLSKDELKYLKQLESIETRLSNKDFISNAPGHIVVADEQKLRELKIKLDKIQEQLKSFS